MKRKISNQSYNPSSSLQLSNQWKIPQDCARHSRLCSLCSHLFIFNFVSSPLWVGCRGVYILYLFVLASSPVILYSLWIFTSGFIGLNYHLVYTDVSQCFSLNQNSLLSCTPLNLTALRDSSPWMFHKYLKPSALKTEPTGFTIKYAFLSPFIVLFM